jgi:hypothetical protein
LRIQRRCCILGTSKGVLKKTLREQKFLQIKYMKTEKKPQTSKQVLKDKVEETSTLWGRRQRK